VYRNDTCEGWTVDATVTDRVLAIKGGANAYNVNGGTSPPASIWTQPGHTHTAGTIGSLHVHQVYNSTGATNSADQIYDSNGTAQDLTKITKVGGALGGGAHIEYYIIPASGSDDAPPDMYTATAAADTGTTAASATAATYRPAAAVGTLQYPDTT